MTKLSAGTDAVPKTDQDGFLEQLSDWSEQVASQIAENENITLTQNHWEIINLVRKFYKNYQHSPEMRPLVKFARLELGEQKGNSIYLLSLFPQSPAKISCKIAGLPKPVNCL